MSPVIGMNMTVTAIVDRYFIERGGILTMPPLFMRYV